MPIRKLAVCPTTSADVILLSKRLCQAILEKHFPVWQSVRQRNRVRLLSPLPCHTKIKSRERTHSKRFNMRVKLSNRREPMGAKSKYQFVWLMKSVISWTNRRVMLVKALPITVLNSINRLRNYRQKSDLALNREAWNGKSLKTLQRGRIDWRNKPFQLSTP